MFKIYDGREKFYQWDLDRKLIVEDPAITEVHFCNRTDSCSLVCETYVEDGVTLVNVPNILLQTDWKIHIYAYDGLHTKHDECYEVISRTKPADYVYTETEVKTWEALEERMDILWNDAGDVIEDIYDVILDLPTKPYVEEQITEAMKDSGSGDFVITADVTIYEALGLGDIKYVSNISATYSEILEAYESGKKIVLVVTCYGWDNSTLTLKLDKFNSGIFSFNALSHSMGNLAILTVVISKNDESVSLLDIVRFDDMTEYVDNALGDVETALNNIIAIQDALLGGETE